LSIIASAQPLNERWFLRLTHEIAEIRPELARLYDALMSQPGLRPKLNHLHPTEQIERA